jgi:acyl carrier protein
MAVAGLFTALEDRFGFVLEEDEIDGDLLETYGALLSFVARKQGNG